MRAVIFDSPGAPDVFYPANVPTPVVGENDVLIAQTYAGVNYGDVIRRRRGVALAEPPHVLGFEGCGRIEAVGAAVSTFRIGDRVGYLAERGGYAELVRVKETAAFPAPDGVDDALIAGSIVVGATALHLVERANLRSGMTVLVHGAAGGVGSLIVQLALEAGAMVIGSVSSEEKQAFVRALGATPVDRRTDWASTVASLAPQGMDVIFDCVGQGVLEANMRLLRRMGTLLYYGSTSGHPAFPGDNILMNALTIRGFVVFDLLQQPDVFQRTMQVLSERLAAGTLRVHVEKVLPLSDVGTAHELLEDRAVRGKLVLTLRA